MTYKKYGMLLLLLCVGVFTACGQKKQQIAAEENPYFIIQEQLSEILTVKLSGLAILEIQNILSDGIKNGEFADYRQAYEMVSRLCDLESSGEMKYNLIYVDEDDIPELAAGESGYYMNLYTWNNGKIYTLMDNWAYGAMGNAGYEYSAKKNSIKNDNSDYAGAILHRTYMSINETDKLDTVVQIKTYNFDDVNQNGILDEDEMESFGKYSVNYIGSKKITDEEYNSYGTGTYQYIEVPMDIETLKSNLNQ